MSLERNGNVVPPIGIQKPDRLERGTQDTRLCPSVVTGGRDEAGAQEGSTTTAETRDDGNNNIRYAAEMYKNKDGGGRYYRWWRRWRMITSGEMQVDEDSGIIHDI